MLPTWAQQIGMKVHGSVLFLKQQILGFIIQTLVGFTFHHQPPITYGSTIRI